MKRNTVHNIFDAGATLSVGPIRCLLIVERKNQEPFYEIFFPEATVRLTESIRTGVLKMYFSFGA